MRSDWYWVRHGALLQDPGRYAGRLDLPTVPPDVVAARRLMSQLPQGAVWLTSPLARARQTVQALNPEANAVIVDDLTDQDLGSWAGRRQSEVHKANPQIDWSTPSNIVPEGGESFDTVVTRVASLIERLTQHYPDRPLVVVSHLALIRAAMVLALDLPNEGGFQFDVSPFSLTHLSWSGPDALGERSDDRLGVWRAHTTNRVLT
ncbi:MAG: histidine phosphatase family protein [Parvibaculaceae bacterium]|nr:histidine phosphatase family protein [Parvibaculaceae bacterium]